MTPVAVVPESQDGNLRLYYLVRFEDARRNILCLAQSEDGSRWTKPDLGDGSNVVMRASQNLMDWGVFMPVSVVRRAEMGEAQPWKMIYWDRPDPEAPPGICLAASEDGLSWQPVHNRPLITGANDAMSLVEGQRDAQLPFGGGNWHLYQQTWKYNPQLQGSRDNLKGMHRRISLWKADDFAGPWIGPITVLEPDGDDPHDLQFYWLTPYRRPGGGYKGLLSCHHTDDQTMDIQLVSSNDGWNWNRSLDRKTLLGTGPQGSFDCGIVIAWPQPLLWREQWLVFYHGRPTVHDHRYRFPEDEGVAPAGGIGLARFDAGDLN